MRMLGNWVFIPIVLGLSLLAIAHYDQTGYARGVRDTVTLLEPHLCKETR